MEITTKLGLKGHEEVGWSDGGEGGDDKQVYGVVEAIARETQKLSTISEGGKEGNAHSDLGRAVGSRYRRL